MIGKKAPQFTGINQDGQNISLKDYKGKKVILYFYPKDNTPGCTAQACNLRDNMNDLLSKGISVLGISSDNVSSHKKFHTKQNLNFPLIADEDKSIHEKYDTWQLKKFMGREFMGTVRTTFLINEEQKVEFIINKPNTKNHTEEILKLWNL